MRAPFVGGWLVLSCSAALAHGGPPLSEAVESSLGRAARAAGRGGFALLPPSADRDVGDVAVIVDDDGTLIDGRGDFDFVGAIRKFYRTHADAYDTVVLFTDFEPFGLGSVVAYASPLKSEVEGIGDVFQNGRRPVDFGRYFGAPDTLQSFVVMNDIARYPEDPREPFLVAFHTVGVLAQEFGHRWGVFAHCRGPGGAPGPYLLSRDEAHWSFFFHSCGSSLDGNVIQDRGDGTFETLAPGFGYSMFDLYLMGLAPAEEAPPSFIVRAPRDFFPATDGLGRPWSADHHAIAGVSFRGEKRVVTVEDLVAAEGPRRPAFGAAQDVFRVAFALVVPGGRDPSPGSVEKVDRIRVAFEEHFRAATLGRGEVRTRLDGGGANGAPVVVGVRPSIVRPGERVPVVIHAERVDSAATVEIVGGGVTLTDLVPLGAIGFRATLAVDPAAAPGERELIITNPGGRDRTRALLVEGPGMAPRAERLDPITLRRGASRVFFLAAELLQPGAKVEVTGSGLEVKPVGQVSTGIYFSVEAAGDAPLGRRDVTVRNPDGQGDTLPAVLTVWDPGAPVVSLQLEPEAEPMGGPCPGPTPVQGPRAEEYVGEDGGGCGGCGGGESGLVGGLAALAWILACRARRAR